LTAGATIAGMMREKYLVSFTISERNYVHRSQREKRESTYFIISLSERESVVVRTREGRL
jgi:hypothetical protein